ncbi:MAG: nuclear transport factor 2 family protein [Leptospiraceae bacterium]|nr:nuclear transport factor 2 family protein [Leptospiraceae bacterium]
MSELEIGDYRAILEQCVAAWNRSDAEGTASFYTDEMDYRDPNVPDGIHTRADFTKYLRLLFRLWPVQEWHEDELLEHAEKGCFTVCYRFRFANPRRSQSIQGHGIDRIEFRGSSIRRNWVYLNADAWRRWIKLESSGMQIYPGTG